MPAGANAPQPCRVRSSARRSDSIYHPSHTPPCPWNPPIKSYVAPHLTAVQMVRYKQSKQRFSYHFYSPSTQAPSVALCFYEHASFKPLAKTTKQPTETFLLLQTKQM